MDSVILGIWISLLACCSKQTCQQGELDSLIRLNAGLEGNKEARVDAAEKALSMEDSKPELPLVDPGKSEFETSPLRPH